MRFPEFNDEWNKDYLGDLCEVNGRIGFRGYTKSDLVKAGEGALTLGGKHIDSNDELDLSDPEYLSWEKYHESPEIKVKKNNIILAQRGTLGRSALIDKDIGKATINPSMVLLKNFNINNIFLHYFLTTTKIKKEIIKKSSSTAVPMISQREIKKIKISYPSSKEQIKVSNFFSNIDKKIDLMERKHKLIKKYRNGLMREIFTQNIKFSNNELGLFKLGEIVELMRNGSNEVQVNFETEFPVTRIETISKGNINFDKVGFVETIDKSYQLKKGDILLSNINSLKYIGNCVYFDMDKILYHGMNLMLIRFKENFNKKFLYYYIKYHKNWFQRMARQAVNQASINQTSLKKFPFTIPKLKTDQDKIADFLSEMDNKIDSVEQQLEKIKEFKKYLLQQMFI